MADVPTSTRMSLSIGLVKELVFEPGIVSETFRWTAVRDNPLMGWRGELEKLGGGVRTTEEGPAVITYIPTTLIAPVDAGKNAGAPDRFAKRHVFITYIYRVSVAWVWRV
jgi:hypothetical protein